MCLYVPNPYVCIFVFERIYILGSATVEYKVFASTHEAWVHVTWIRYLGDRQLETKQFDSPHFDPHQNLSGIYRGVKRADIEMAGFKLSVIHLG